MPIKIVVIGGGFAGLQVAQTLERSLPADCALTLVSRENFITFNPLLPEVVGASILPGHVIAPHRQMLRRSSVCMVEVAGIDTASKTVEYLGEGSGVLPYDHLVLTCGADANLEIIKGMASYALPLKTLGDALFLRNRVIARLEQAQLQPDLEHRRWLARFVVVGGGFSGVETAGALADFTMSSLRYYPRIRPEDLSIVLIHSGDRLLPELPPRLGEFTLRHMRKRGIDVHLTTRCTRVTDLDIEVEGMQNIAAGTVICTIGTKPNSLLEGIPTEKIRGRLKVSPDFSVPGVDGVWAAGDCAAVVNAEDGEVCPPTAQFAHAQATVLADNLVSRISGRPTRPFRYRPKGELSSIGHTKAVAQIYGFKASGFVAWWIWRALYLARMPTFSRKCRLFLEWSWAMFFPPDIAHFGYRRSMRHKMRPVVEAPTAPAMMAMEMQPPPMPAERTEGSG